MAGFIKVSREGEDLELMAKDYPLAIVLLLFIAKRAHRGSTPNILGLEQGEALIGDYENYGMSRRQYRTSLDKLKTWQKVTTKTTNKGTIVKLIDKTIIDINEEKPTTKVANDRPTTGQRPATNKNERMKEVYGKLLESFNQVLKNKVATLEPMEKNISHWLTVYTMDQISLAISNIPLDNYWCDKITPTIFFRLRDKNQEPIDKIGDFLALRPESQHIEEIEHDAKMQERIQFLKESGLM